MKRILGLFMAMALLVTITACSEAATTDSGKKEEAKAEEKVAPTGLNTPLKVGDVVFTAHGLKTATNVGGQFGQNAKGEFVIVEVTVKNEGKESIMTDSSFFKLKVGDVTYDADSAAGIFANEQNSFFLEQVNPGLENKGFVVFDVPAGTTGFTMQVQTGLFGTETGEITLQ